MERSYIKTKKTPDGIQVTVDFSYSKSVIPPRCRNPRDVTFHDGTTMVTIPCVSKEDAPVAIIKRENCIFKYTRQYRWWNNKLYACLFRGYASGEPYSKLGKIGVDGRTAWEDYYHNNPRVYNTYEERLESIASYYGKFLMVGNQLYQEVSEPMYVVMTFGLGNNHGGTALMDASYYNSNIPHKNYYRLDELKQALKVKDEVAKRRGDTKDIGRKCSTKYQILIPEAIQANPARDYGGEGDSFINTLNAITESGGSHGVKSVMAVCALAAQTR